MNTSDSCSPYELSFGLRALLGVPSELYFFLRWSFLMLTVSKKSLVTSTLIDQQKQERAVLKKAIIFIYGLFGNILDLWSVFLEDAQSIHCDLSYPQIQDTTRIKTLLSLNSDDCATKRVGY
jgi:hypothetical protein